MHRRPTPTFTALLALAALAPALAAPDAPTAPADPTAGPQTYTVRYVCFAAQPRAGVPDGNNTGDFQFSRVQPFFDRLEENGGPEMGPTPEAFLNTLRRTEPNLTFRLLFAGAVTTNAQGSATISHTPAQTDPFKPQATDHLKIFAGSAMTVTVSQTGSVSYTVPADAAASFGGGFGGGYTSPGGGQSWSSVSPGWNGSRTDILLGRTYSQDTSVLSDRERLVFAFCILKGRVDQDARVSHPAQTHRAAR